MKPTLRLALLPLFCWLLPLAAVAQQFGIRAFRPLPNDISAYITPVRDLNGEACALIKVVGSHDFAFSTPLGIVKRTNDIGEVWLYVPRGTVQLTVKHPQWGVLRDYRFPQPLESRMTYELILDPPADAWPPADLPPLPPPARPGEATHPADTETLPVRTTAIRRPRERLRYLLLASVGLQASPSAGIRAGVMRRHGAYLLLQADLHAMPHTRGECLRDGTTPHTAETPYYTGHTAEARRLLLAGALHRLAGQLCLYEGLGYGCRKAAWETTEGLLLKNTGYSAQGISAEAGLLYRLGRTAFSAGVLTIAAKHWEATIGVGIHF